MSISLAKKSQDYLAKEIVSKGQEVGEKNSLYTEDWWPWSVKLLLQNLMHHLFQDLFPLFSLNLICREETKPSLLLSKKKNIWKNSSKSISNNAIAKYFYTPQLFLYSLSHFLPEKGIWQLTSVFISSGRQFWCISSLTLTRGIKKIDCGKFWLITNLFQDNLKRHKI